MYWGVRSRWVFLGFMLVDDVLMNVRYRSDVDIMAHTVSETLVCFLFSSFFSPPFFGITFADRKNYNRARGV